jgi:hypothetical protein
MAWAILYDTSLKKSVQIYLTYNTYQQLSRKSALYRLFLKIPTHWSEQYQISLKATQLKNTDTDLMEQAQPERD